MVNIKRMTTKRLGELLVEEKLLTEEQVRDALKEQSKSGELLGQALVRLGYLTEYDIAKCISLQFSLPFIHVPSYQTARENVSLVPLEDQQRHQFVVLDRIGDVLVVAIAGLLSEDVFKEIGELTGSDVQVFVTTSTDVAQALEKYAEGGDA